MAWSTPFLQGFLLGGSLIVAIGAQNAFVLRQGLLRRYVLAVTTICFLSDAILIAAGVAGLGGVLQTMPGLLRLIGWVGALFLFVYGGLAFRRALRPGRLEAAATARNDLGSAIAACLAFTFLNPHVYLDTIVLVGGLSGRFHDLGRLAFGAGAASASAIWFYGLGFGARLLAPIFARPQAWRVLDILIGIVMWSLAAGLIRQAL